MITTEISPANLNTLPVTVNNGRMEFAAQSLSSPNLDGNIPLQERYRLIRDLQPGWYAKVNGDAFALIIDIVQNPLTEDEYNLRILEDSSVRRIVVNGSDEVLTRYEDWDNKTIGTTGWMITSAGNVLLSNAAVRGTIEATDGEFFGTVTARNARFGVLDINNVTKYGIALTDDDNTNYWFDDGSFNVGGTPGITFDPVQDKITLGSGVEIQGQVVADTGVIGGWNIVDDEIYKGEMHIHSNIGNGNAAIYEGIGSWGNINTGFYMDGQGQFSLKDRLIFDPTGGDLSSLTVIGKIRGAIENYSVVDPTSETRNITTITHTTLSLDLNNDGVFATEPVGRVSHDLTSIATIGDTVIIEGTASSDGAYRVVGTGSGYVDVYPRPASAVAGGTIRVREMLIGLHAASGAAPAGLGIKLDEHNYWFLNNHFKVGSSASGIEWDGAAFTVRGTGTYDLSLQSSLSDTHIAIHDSNETPAYNASHTAFYTNADGQFSLGDQLTFEIGDYEPDTDQYGGTLTIKGDIVTDSLAVTEIEDSGIAVWSESEGQYNIVGSGIEIDQILTTASSFGQTSLHLTEGSNIYLSNGANIKFKQWLGADTFNIASFVMRSTSTPPVMEINVDPDFNAPDHNVEAGDVVVLSGIGAVTIGGEQVEVNGTYVVHEDLFPRQFTVLLPERLLGVTDNFSRGGGGVYVGALYNDKFTVDSNIIGNTVRIDATGGLYFAEGDSATESMRFNVDDPTVQVRRYPFSLRKSIVLPEVAKGVNPADILGTRTLQFDIPYPGTITLDYSAVLYSIEPASGYVYMATSDPTGGDLQFATGWPMTYQSNTGGTMHHISGKTVYTAHQGNETVMFKFVGATNELGDYTDTVLNGENGLVRMRDLRGIITYEPFGVVYEGVDLG